MILDNTLFILNRVISLTTPPRRLASASEPVILAVHVRRCDRLGIEPEGCSYRRPARRLAAGGRDALQGAAQGRNLYSASRHGLGLPAERAASATAEAVHVAAQNDLTPAPNEPDGAGSGLGARLQLRLRIAAATASSRARTRRPPCAPGSAFRSRLRRLRLSPRQLRAKQETNRSRDAPAEYGPSEASHVFGAVFPNLDRAKSGHVKPASAAACSIARIACSGRRRCKPDGPSVRRPIAPRRRAEQSAPASSVIRRAGEGLHRAAYTVS